MNEEILYVFYLFIFYYIRLKDLRRMFFVFLHNDEILFLCINHFWEEISIQKLNLSVHHIYISSETVSEWLDGSWYK